MKDFIAVHYQQNNQLALLPTAPIICAVLDNKQTKVYIKGNNTMAWVINETPTMMSKQMGEGSDFILIHTRASNTEILLSKSVIERVEAHVDGKGSMIKLYLKDFDWIETNESPMIILNKLNG